MSNHGAIEINTPKEELIWVDEHGHSIGVGEKLLTHQQGQRHRAFSIFLLNDKDELLLQKRANTKYHSGGLWANTCCGHPCPGESTQKAARRRLFEELGITYQTPFRSLGHASYKLPVGPLIENEFTYLFQGRYKERDIHFRHNEVQDTTWISYSNLIEKMQKNPESFAPWLRFYIEQSIAIF